MSESENKGEKKSEKKEEKQKNGKLSFSKDLFFISAFASQLFDFICPSPRDPETLSSKIKFLCHILSSPLPLFYFSLFLLPHQWHPLAEVAERSSPDIAIQAECQEPGKKILRMGEGGGEIFFKGIIRIIIKERNRKLASQSATRMERDKRNIN